MSRKKKTRNKKVNKISAFEKRIRRKFNSRKIKNFSVFFPILVVLVLVLPTGIVGSSNATFRIALAGIWLLLGFYLFIRLYFRELGPALRENKRQNLQQKRKDIIRMFLEDVPHEPIFAAYKEARRQDLRLSFNNIRQFYKRDLDIAKIVQILTYLREGKGVTDESYFLQYLHSKQVSNELLDAFLFAVKRNLPTNFHELAFLDSHDQKLTREERRKHGRLHEHLEVLLAYAKADPLQKENFREMMQDYRYSEKLTRIIEAMELCNEKKVNWPKEQLKAYTGDHKKLIFTFLKAQSRGLQIASIQDLVIIEQAENIDLKQFEEKPPKEQIEQYKGREKPIKETDNRPYLDKVIDKATREQQRQIGPFTVYTADEQPVKITVMLTYKLNLQHAINGQELKSLLPRIQEAYTAEIGNMRYDRLYGRASDVSRKVKAKRFEANSQVSFVDLSISSIEVMSIYGAPHKLEKANYERALEETVADRIKTEADAQNRKARARIKDMEARIKEAEARYQEQQMRKREENSGK